VTAGAALGSAAVCRVGATAAGGADETGVGTVATVAGAPHAARTIDENRSSDDSGFMRTLEEEIIEEG
jgi:hypothetical protein